MKPGTTQNLTLPLEVCKALLEAHNVILLASDFISGLIGISPEDVLPKKTSDTMDGEWDKK